MKTATEAWIDSISRIKNNGNRIKPRGMETEEVLNQTIAFNMNYPICHHNQRKLSYKFMAAEAYWITSGSSLVEDIAPYNSHIAQFSDDGYIFNGAYGPAFSSQLNFVVDTLTKDLDSRQAVMTIWHPNPEETKDHKCTIALQFSIRQARIHTTVFMRSNDVILGRPYDMFNFTVMTLRVLTRLNAALKCSIVLGNMHIFCTSSHYYEQHYDMVKEILNNKEEYKITSLVPLEAMFSWNYVVNSLLATRDNEKHTLWQIRP